MNVQDGVSLFVEAGATSLRSVRTSSAAEVRHNINLVAAPHDLGRMSSLLKRFSQPDFHRGCLSISDGSSMMGSLQIPARKA